jgi:cell cycle arrest protein BUB3
VSCLSFYADKSTRFHSIPFQPSISLSTGNDMISIDTVITASWERTLRVWDPRVSSYQPVSISQLDERAYYMDSASNYIVVALASRQFNIFDPRMTKEPVQRRESSLKYMTRSVACMADGTGAPPASSHHFAAFPC